MREGAGSLVPTGLIRGLILLTGLLAAGTASAQQEWAAAEGRASALLPAPAAGGPVVSASLDCAEQRWSLRLQMAAGQPTVSGPVTLSIDREPFSRTASPDGPAVAIGLTGAMLERLKSGTRLSVRLSLDGPDVLFGLRGSRRAIDAAAPLCTPRDMSAYLQVLPATVEPADRDLGARLRDNDIKAFRAATSSEPVMNVGRLAGPGSEGITFVQLCGSSWYFGRTGCNIAGYLTSGTDSSQVFDGEGTALYATRESQGRAWPDLIATGPSAGGPDIVWRWQDGKYQFLRQDIAE